MKIAVFGGNGQLGREFQKRLPAERISFVASDRSECDITQPDSVKRLLDEQQPEVLINCAAYNLVDEAEDNRALAFAVNAEAVKNLAQCADRRRIKLVHFSTDYVFDGAKGLPYIETDATHPLNVYAESKLAGEKLAQEYAKNHLVLRLSWLIGAGKQNFLYKLGQWAQKSDKLKITSDEVAVPTLTQTVVEVTLAALKADLRGLYHLTNSGQASRIELARAYFDAVGLKPKLVPVLMSSLPQKAKRPLYSVMSNALIQKKSGAVIPDWREALRELVKT